MTYVYVLHWADGQYYVGVASNVSTRLIKHRFNIRHRVPHTVGGRVGRMYDVVSVIGSHPTVECARQQERELISAGDEQCLNVQCHQRAFESYATPWRSLNPAARWARMKPAVDRAAQLKKETAHVS